MIGIISIADISLRTSGIAINRILFGSFSQNSNCKWDNCLSFGSIVDYFPNLKNNRLWEILQIDQFEDSF
jgi:hypothetical protein